MPEKPLIAIPVAAHTLQELKEKTAAIRSLPFDVLEWRMDGLHPHNRHRPHQQRGRQLPLRRCPL